MLRTDRHQRFGFSYPVSQFGMRNLPSQTRPDRLR
ncbi:Uncharacterised protein [Vibrio cholerae]|nr:Uncharacterised protein [Vibrio cholerae]